MRWLRENSEVLDALASILTVIIAVGALIAVKLQIDGENQTQREQSARDSYREHLALAIQYPTVALADYCDLKEPKERLTYSAYIEHFLYTAEQLVELGEHWKLTIRAALNEHSTYLCSRSDWVDYPDDILSIIHNVRADRCRAIITCEVDE